MTETANPNEPRFKVIETLDGVEVVIPTKYPWLLVIVLTAFIVLMVSVITDEFLEILEDADGRARLLVILFVVVVIGSCVLFIIAPLLLRQLAGALHIRVSPSHLVIKEKALWLGHTKAYELSQVKDFRIVPQSSDKWWKRLEGGLIAFDYGASTVRFAEGLNDTEVKQIVERLGSAIRQTKHDHGYDS
jgi:hypothetical protein